ncbi:sulfotransferase [Pseudooceanicola sp. LIPI14-2-Ac024]|uniref:sulfotransferase n=1 Tax=Pseudooceanicola sp. LIPI14-2-Ac024 TaxID=3344875 RepID=UPI0035CEE47F
MSRLRVINLGLPKSGTTTLGVALRRAGLSVADHRIRPRKTDDPALRGAFVGDLLYRGYFETGDPLALLDGFDAVAECSFLTPGRSAWPQMDFGLIAAIRAHHPGARFVATRRDPGALAASMEKWTNMRQRLDQGQIPGLPRGYGAEAAARERWIAGHYAHLGHLYGGDDAVLMLDVEAGDAPRRLSGFLGIDIPWWGRANANPEGAA